MKKTAITVLIIFAPLLLALLLHSAIIEITTIPQATGFLVHTIGFEKTSSLYFLIGFVIVYLCYRLFEKELYGNNYRKSLSYSICIGSLWVIATVENAPVLGSNPLFEFITGSFDFIPVVFMGLLIALLCKSKPCTANDTSKHLFLQNLSAFIIIALVLLTGRAVFALASADSCGFLSMPVLGIATTLALSLNVLLLRRIISQNIIKPLQGARTTAVIFSMNWFMPIMWIPFIAESYFQLYAPKLILDCALVSAGLVISEKFIPRISPSK